MVTPDPKPPVPLRFPGALFLLFVHFAAYTAVLMLGGAMSEGETVGFTFLLAAEIVGPLTALYVGLLRHAPHERTAAALRLGSPAGWQWVVLGCAVIAGVALAPVVLDVGARLMKLFPVDGGDAAEADRAPSPVLFLFLVTAAYPVVIELFFRGFLQTRLTRTLGAVRAWSITLLLYVLARPDPRAMPAALIIGAPLGLMMAWGGSAWIPLAGHVAHRVAIVLLVLGLPNLLDASGTLPWWGNGVCLAAAVAALLGGWRVSRGRAR